MVHDSIKTASSGYKQTDTDIIHRTCASIYKTCTRSSQMEFQHWGGGSKQYVPPLTKKQLSINTCWERANQFCSNGVTQVISTTLPGRPHVQKYLANTIWDSWFFRALFILFCIFLLLFFFWLFIVSFSFGFLLFWFLDFVFGCSLCFFFLKDRERNNMKLGKSGDEKDLREVRWQKIWSK